jgi:hypothetical protein
MRLEWGSDFWNRELEPGLKLDPILEPELNLNQNQTWVSSFGTGTILIYFFKPIPKVLQKSQQPPNTGGTRGYLRASKSGYHRQHKKSLCFGATPRRPSGPGVGGKQNRRYQERPTRCGEYEKKEPKVLYFGCFLNC